MLLSDEVAVNNMIQSRGGCLTMTHSVQSGDVPLKGFSSRADVLTVLTMAQRLTGGERASLMLPLRATRELQVVAANGLDSDRLLHTRVRLGAPVAGLVAETGRALFINDEHEFAVVVGRQPVGERSAAFISVPVPLDSMDRGVLNIADPIGRTHFRSEDFDAVQGLAVMIGRLDFLRTQLADERDKISVLRKELVWLQESERHRLARDLHDEAGHALTMAVFQIDLERVKPTTDPGTKATLTRARAAVMDCAIVLNDMAFRLRPRILEDLGLISALRVLATQVHDASDIRVNLNLNGDVQALSREAELTAFRVVQEGLTNVRKHAKAAHAWVELTFHATTLEISVCDDGVGTTTEKAMENQHSSQGLRGMRERVELLGGELDFSQAAERMTYLSVRLPLE